ncbi:hypothetical protein AB0C52_12755 [Streptomyces sp. NPDC048717]|uniref:hypothetical protein n=1 Tax=Streptomyces sp. NPDC048717 TaxID=3154928 RepID=UPI0034208AB8
MVESTHRHHPESNRVPDPKKGTTMPVTLDKAPRPFTVFLQDDKVVGTMPTPDGDEVDAIHLDAYFGMCLNVYEVTAIDGYEAHQKGAEAHAWTINETNDEA